VAAVVDRRRGDRARRRLLRHPHVRPDPLDAYQLVTQAVESPLANVCDTNYTSIAKMPKRYLPTAAFGGIHDQLRELATSL
jgi:hypothetical protein